MRLTESTRRYPGRRGLWVLTLVLSSACSGRDDRRPEGLPPAAWQLAEPPVVVIGEANTPAHQLDRVYGGVVRGDGSILIGNSGTAELRLFDDRGTHRLTIGGSGGGPGEFRSINWMRAYRGDSILVFDMRAQRFSVWTANGSFGRTFRAESPHGSPQPVGVFDDGTLLVALGTQYDPRQQPGTVRDRLTLVRTSPTGQVLRELGTFPGAEWLIYTHPGSYRAAKVPFGREAHVAVTGDHFAYASSDSSTLSVFDTAGALVRRVAIPASRREVTEEEIRGELETIDDLAARRALERHFDARLASLPAPALYELHADRDGNLWIRTTSSAGASRAYWVVVSPSGENVGSIILPADALPLHIRSTHLLLREADSDGVQRVTLREVKR